MGMTDAAAEDGEILGVDIDQASVDGAVAGDHAIARNLAIGQAEVIAVMGDEDVHFAEAAFVEQQLETFTRRHLALRMLPRDSFRSTTAFGR